MFIRLSLPDRRISPANPFNLACAGLAFGLLFMPATGQAFDLGTDLRPDDAQYLLDPSFIPRAGQIYSDSGYNHYWVNSTSQFSNSTVGNARVDTDQFTQQFWYGITDQLSFSASDSYQISDGNHQFTNPKLTLAYRVVEQAKSPVSVDIEAIYYPPAVTSTEAGGLTFHVSREMKSLTLQIEGNTVYYSNGTEIGDYWTYLAGLRSQWRFADHWGLNSGFVYSGRTDGSLSQFSSNASGQNSNTFSTAVGDTYTPYIGLSYELWPKHATVGIEYQRSFLGDIKQSSTYLYVPVSGAPLSGSNSFNTIDRTEDFFALDIIFLF